MQNDMVLQLCCYSKNKNRRKTTYQFEVSYKHDAGIVQDYLEPIPSSSSPSGHAVPEDSSWEVGSVRLRHSKSLEDTISRVNPKTPSFLKYKYRKLQEIDNAAGDIDGKLVCQILCQLAYLLSFCRYITIYLLLLIRSGKQ